MYWVEEGHVDPVPDAGVRGKVLAIWRWPLAQGGSIGATP